MTLSNPLEGAKTVRRKYGNVPTVVDGITFHSAKEARRWSALKLLERAGQIADLRRQVPYVLAVNGQKITTYRSDFNYVEAGVEVVEDVKGVITKEFALKSKLMKAIHGIDVRLS